MRRYTHRCTGAAADHCRICSFLPEDDEPEPRWVIQMPLSSGTLYYVSREREWTDDIRRAKKFDVEGHAHQLIREDLGHCPAEVAKLEDQP